MNKNTVMQPFAVFLLAGGSESHEMLSANLVLTLFGGRPVHGDLAAL